MKSHTLNSAINHTKENQNQQTLGKQAADQEFLDTLKQRHNLDEQTIANLEMRMNGKFSRTFDLSVSRKTGKVCQNVARHGLTNRF